MSLDWAKQLRLLVKGVWVPELERGSAADREAESHRSSGTAQTASMPEVDEAIMKEKGHVEQACARTCVQAGVRWEGFCGDGCLRETLQQVVTPENLLVFDEALSWARRKNLPVFPVESGCRPSWPVRKPGSPLSESWLSIRAVLPLRITFGTP